MPFPPPTIALCLLFALGAFFIVDSSCVCPLTFHYSISEEQPNGTKVGSLLDDLRKQESNLGPLDSFHIIRADETLPFSIKAQDGVISTKGQLDKEELCPTLDVCEFNFTVLYRKGKTVDCLQVQVAVMDRNDNGPSFPSTTQQFELSENSSLLKKLPLVKAVDPDKGLNGLHSYSLSPNEHFALAVSMSNDGTKQPELVLMKSFDRELEDSYQLTLFAWDGGNPARSASILVRVKVTDTNDNIPIFERNEITVEVYENVTRNTVIATVRATDLDEGVNSEVRYSISDQTDLQSISLFRIDPQTGEVKVNYFLNYEVQTSHTLIIQAEDMGPGAIPSFCKLHVKVMDVNDSEPMITILSPDPVFYLSDLTEIATTVTHLKVSDDGNKRVSLWFDDSTWPFRLVQLTEDEYKLVTAKVLDRGNAYRLKIMAIDHRAPTRRSVKEIRIEVTGHES